MYPLLTTRNTDSYNVGIVDNKVPILSNIGDVGYDLLTYVDTNNWSESRSEEGTMCFEWAPPPSSLPPTSETLCLSAV